MNAELQQPRGEQANLMTDSHGAEGLDPSHVLIIDDTRAIHDDFRKILASSQQSSLEADEAELFDLEVSSVRQAVFDLHSAYQGNEGLTMAQRAVDAGRCYSVAFVDVRMPPGWDGVETASRLWEADPDLQIVICSAYSDYSWQGIIQRLGHRDSLMILKKPFDPVEVLQLAHALTKKWLLTKQSKSRFAELQVQVDERTQELRTVNEMLQRDIAARELVEARLTHLLRQSPAIIYSFKTQGGGCMPTWVSENVIHLVGYSAPECSVSDWWPAHVHPGDLDAVSRELTARAQEQDVTLTYRLRHKSGGYRWVRDQRRQVPNNDEANAEVVGTWVDVTAQKDLEEQLRQALKMEAVGRLAGGVAHDFNNLLTVILGNTEMVLAGTGTILPNEAVESLKQVSAASLRAANLTRQLLAFSRKQILHTRPVNINEVIGDLTKMLHRIIGEDIELQCNFASALPLVQADIGMIEQVLVNFVVNARDAMPNGGKLIIHTDKCTLAGRGPQNPEARAGDFVCLNVTDTGTGIAAEHMAHLFEPFFTTKEVGKGTGLGLATVHGIVKQHQGWIEVASQLGAGTTFQVYLPVFCGSASVDEKEPSEAAPRGGNENILVVEDDQAVRTLTRLMLEKCGYGVRVASSGREAAQLLSNSKDKFDLLLTDIVMPDGMTGIQLAELTRAQRPELKVVFMSGYAGDSVAKRESSEGPLKHRFLQKPFQSQELSRTIRDCLDEQVKTHKTKKPAAA
jgi:PAS domain S-box-containing protein